MNAVQSLTNDARSITENHFSTTSYIHTITCITYVTYAKVYSPTALLLYDYQTSEARCFMHYVSCSLQKCILKSLLKTLSRENILNYPFFKQS